ncbi:MAG: Fic family protein [Holosporaceae bacterium]|jgi:fido (protein-threonine AMPylation protein)|nr:Fic family protein [Holosporaceae bacterium]
MNKRQQEILKFIYVEKLVSASSIHEHIINLFHESIARITIIRDLDFLLKNEFIKKQGLARNVKYCSISSNPLLEYFNVTDYFKNDCDDRSIKNRTFCFDIFDHLHDLFSVKELLEMEQINEKFRYNLKKLSPVMLKKEFERLTIEFSWKSSHIEGNTYSLLDTEHLIKENIEAEGHSKEEAIMILNHKRVFDYIFQNAPYYQEITLAKIEDLHRMLTVNLGIFSGLRSSPVGIVGTNYKPLGNKHQINDAMCKLIDVVKATKAPFEKAFIMTLMISHIQPFEDGNKRTSRILANAILLAHNYCPLSYRSVNEVEYKKAIILFYEQNSAVCFKKIFVEQFKQALEKYF